LRLWRSPRSSIAFIRRAPRRFLLLRRERSRGNAITGVKTHRLFGESERILFLAFLTALKNCAAHQRQLL
jgi:hypothetical protein